MMVLGIKLTTIKTPTPTTSEEVNRSRHAIHLMTSKGRSCMSVCLVCSPRSHLVRVIRANSCNSCPLRYLFSLFFVDREKFLGSNFVWKSKPSLYDKNSFAGWLDVDESFCILAKCSHRPF